MPDLRAVPYRECMSRHMNCQNAHRIGSALSSGPDERRYEWDLGGALIETPGAKTEHFRIEVRADEANRIVRFNLIVSTHDSRSHKREVSWQLSALCPASGFQALGEGG